MRAALDRRLLTLRRQRETWVADLAVCALGAVFGPADGDSGAAVAPALVADALTPEEREGPVPDDDTNSDDASDAYASGEDEDEPLADMLDELEHAAVDLDRDEDGDGEHPCPVAEETVSARALFSYATLTQQAGDTERGRWQYHCRLRRQ